MKFIKAIANLFGSDVQPRHDRDKVIEQADIKFSTLIESIHSDLLAANQSLQCVGLKYIEKFFDKEVSGQFVVALQDRIDEIETLLEQGDDQGAKARLRDLRKHIGSPNVGTGTNVQYRPKTTSFEMPVLSNEQWHTEKVEVPMVALAPITVPKIEALTLTSKLQTVKQCGDDVYIQMATSETKTPFWRRGKTDADTQPALSISISSEQSRRDIEQMVSDYQTLLRTSQPG